MHGIGIYTWVDGKTYRGEYREDFKEGYGLYEWEDGRKYMGLWLKGK